MATSKMNQEFQKRIKRGIDPDELAKMRRQSIMRHKYGIPKNASKKGKDIENGREK